MSERKTTRKKPVRKDREANYLIIREQFLKIIKQKKKAPTLNELADATGLGITTIKKHLKELEFGQADSPFRVLTPDVIQAIYETSISDRPGAVGAQKLWMQLVEGWSEKSQTDITSGGEKIQQVIKIGYGKPDDQD